MKTVFFFLIKLTPILKYVSFFVSDIKNLEDLNNKFKDIDIVFHIAALLKRNFV